METFSKVEVNLPLLRAIKQVFRYIKFLKELCTNRRKLSNNERASMGENVSAIIQKKLPPKYEDQDMFTILRKISTLGIRKGMWDLGASINVMPMSIYSKLSVRRLKKTRVII